MKYDVIIVGAGPAGLLAAWCLEGTGINYAIIEKGNLYLERDKELPYDVSYGFGGAGLFSDGKFSYAPAASQLWSKLDINLLRFSYDKTRKLFSEIGIELKEWNEDWAKTQENLTGNVKEYESIYLDEEKRKQLLAFLYDKLNSEIIFKKNVKEVQIVEDEYKVICEDQSIYTTYNLIMATGKSSCSKLFTGGEIKWVYWNEMGVRIEVDSNGFMPMQNKTLDYKYIEKIDDIAEIRTFCSCKKGIVRKSLFENHITYNGEANDEPNAKSNIGIIIRTQDMNSIYAKEMKACFDDAKETKCSISEYGSVFSIIGTETDQKIKSMIGKLIKKEYNGEVYGPEVEKYGYYPVLDERLTCRPGLYFAGDATAIFRGLMAAFVSGSYVANCIIENRKKSINASMEKLKIKKSDTDDMKVVFTAQSKAYFYCRDVICQFVFEKGFLPINPFRVFDYFLGDRVERDMIRRGNNQLIKLCDELWVFGSIADGVLFEIASAIDQGKKIRFFSIGTKIEEIREITTAELTFEPEVHARQIKKQDIIDFINQGNHMNIKENYVQVSLADLGLDDMM